MPLKNKLEALLFISPRPLTIKKLAGILEAEYEETKDALTSLIQEYRERGGGVKLLSHGEEVQMVTDVDTADIVQKFLKDETTGELTKPSIETLSIVAYRGPVTKSDLEKIRGVNCSLILRNLMMRGLVVAEEDKKRLITYYTISVDFLKHLGLTKIQDIPEYETLHNPEIVERLLADQVIE